jgi:predicted nuclease of restriction endonuclease-like RecB superfamily
MDTVVSPPLARAVVFQASASRRSRRTVLDRVARDLNVSPKALERSLFADLPPNRLLRAPPEPIHAGSVALSCNLAIAQAALKNSSNITVVIDGNARAIVRHAKLRGLICSVSRQPNRPTGTTSTLEISGPLALFRRTTLYGRHLAELVPHLPWSKSFELHAHCTIRNREGRFTLRPGDPIPPGTAPRRYDSLLERRFARDFIRAAPEWMLIREPKPVQVDGTHIFPDFALVHRADARRLWILEIVGFWTSAYVEEKLRRLRSAGIRNLILCIDASLDCGEQGLPHDCSVVRFRKRIDPRDVLRLVQGDASQVGTRPPPASGRYRGPMPHAP